VSGHSSFELTGIVLAGAAGLKLSAALIMPKRYTRLEALRQAAKSSLPLVYGMCFLLLLAAFVEAFWSSSTFISPMIKYSVGGFFWIILLSYFTWQGRTK
jgi:uncharacterized membrane protein SpoIIM required for sporulation